MCELKNHSSTTYNKQERPNKHSSEVDIVTVSLYILNIGNLDAAKRSFNVELYFTLRWTDERLKDNLDLFHGMNSNNDDIWIPDIYVRNVKNSVKTRFIKV